MILLSRGPGFYPAFARLLVEVGREAPHDECDRTVAANEQCEAQSHARVLGNQSDRRRQDHAADLRER